MYFVLFVRAFGASFRFLGAATTARAYPSAHTHPVGSSLVILNPGRFLGSLYLPARILSVRAATRPVRRLVRWGQQYLLGTDDRNDSPGVRATATSTRSKTIAVQDHCDTFNRRANQTTVRPSQHSGERQPHISNKRLSSLNQHLHQHLQE